MGKVKNAFMADTMDDMQDMSNKQLHASSYKHGQVDMLVTLAEALKFHYAADDSDIDFFYIDFDEVMALLKHNASKELYKAVQESTNAKKNKLFY